jgi:hypothetical protein
MNPEHPHYDEYFDEPPIETEPPPWANGGQPPDAAYDDEPPPWKCPAPYAFPDPASIPRREFLYGKHYLRGEVSLTIAAGGKAKTTLTMVEAIGMAVGRNLLTGEKLHDGPMRVWLVNAEEDQNELDRRVAAILQRFGISPHECGNNRLRVLSLKSSDQPRWHIATLERSVPKLNRRFLNWLIATLKAEGIDVLMIDPLVSFHRVRERENEDMDAVIKDGLGEVAAAAKIAIGLSHHTGKLKFGQTENAVEDSRGASATIWAARISRVINSMSAADATQLGIATRDRRFYLRVEGGKANPVPPEKATWVKLEVEHLPNGDEVAVVASWCPPDPLAAAPGDIAYQVRALVKNGEYVAAPQSSRWVGYPIAPLLGLSLTGEGKLTDEDRAKVKLALKRWYKTNTLAIERRDDGHGKPCKVVIAPANWEAPAKPVETPPEFGEDDF